MLLPLLWPSGPVQPGKIVARWPIKTSVQSPGDLKKTGTMIPITDFLDLTPAADNMSKAFQTVLFPKTAGATFAEGDIVRTRGYVRLVAGEDDGDYHMQLTATPDTFENSLVVEVPKDDPDFVKDGGVSAAATTVRGFVMSQFKTGDPTGRIVVIVNPTYVEVTGQLFFDAEHQAAMSKSVFRGKSIHGKKLPSKTSWEVHPILKIAFAPKP